MEHEPKMQGKEEDPRGERGVRKDQGESVFLSVTRRRKLSVGFMLRWPTSPKRFPSELVKTACGEGL